MMRPFKYTVPCSRPAEVVVTDEWNNTSGEARAALTFDAVFVPPTSASGSQIVDGVLTQTTITKPTLYVEGRFDLRSGDEVVVNGVGGWEVDGDPALYDHPWTGWQAPMVIELRKKVGG